MFEAGDFVVGFLGVLLFCGFFVFLFSRDDELTWGRPLRCS